MDEKTNLTLLQLPYLSGSFESPLYTTHAEDDDGNEFHIYWDVKEGFEDLEDESECCEWNRFRIIDDLGNVRNPEAFQLVW